MFLVTFGSRIESGAHNLLISSRRRPETIQIKSKVLRCKHDSNAISAFASCEAGEQEPL
jgi:hypothetical protein